MLGYFAFAIAQRSFVILLPVKKKLCNIIMKGPKYFFLELTALTRKVLLHNFDLCLNFLVESLNGCTISTQGISRQKMYVYLFKISDLFHLTVTEKKLY